MDSVQTGGRGGGRRGGRAIAMGLLCNGFSTKEVHAHMGDMGYKKSRISQLIKEARGVKRAIPDGQDEARGKPVIAAKKVSKKYEAADANELD